MGGMDGAVLERLAKIMGYMRVAPGAKPKKLKKRDKQRILEGGAAPAGHGAAAAQNGHAAAANGAAEPGSLPPPPKAAAPVDDDVSCLWTCLRPQCDGAWCHHPCCGDV